MKTESVVLYRGIIITCPLCGRSHGLTIKESELHSPNIKDDKIMLICPTCGLEFEGTSVAIWKRSKALASLNEAARSFNNTMSKLSSATKTVYTIFLLDEVNHEVIRCFRTPTNGESLGEILKRLSKTCRPGESYLAIEEVD
jgi:hypothetical protein